MEHCKVSAVGYAVIVAFVIAPGLLWGFVGFKQANAVTCSRVTTALLLVLGTVLFYLAFYVAVWP
jgi:hypothetical protein